jgi:hypothetical protein
MSQREPSPIEHLRELPRRDAGIYEHVKTQERRTLTNKSIACHGVRGAWERASTPAG